jgi:hypothetical protein
MIATAEYIADTTPKLTKASTIINKSNTYIKFLPFGPMIA